jgi:hypothetical protein
VRGTAAGIGQLGKGIEQFDQPLILALVGRTGAHHQWAALSCGQQMPFAAGFAVIGGV